MKALLVFLKTLKETWRNKFEDNLLWVAWQTEFRCHDTGPAFKPKLGSLLIFLFFCCVLKLIWQLDS